jgi:hypothetical protein
MLGIVVQTGREPAEGRRTVSTTCPAKLVRRQKPLIVIMDDPIIHTDDNPLCGDVHCPCWINAIKDLEEATRQIEARGLTVEQWLDREIALGHELLGLEAP